MWSCRPHTNRTLANSTCYDGDFKSVFAGNTHIEKINRVNLLLSNDARQQRVKQPAKRYFILILMSLPERAEGGLVRKTRDVENWAKQKWNCAVKIETNFELYFSFFSQFQNLNTEKYKSKIIHLSWNPFRVSITRVCFGKLSVARRVQQQAENHSSRNRNSAAAAAAGIITIIVLKPKSLMSRQSSDLWSQLSSCLK